MSSLKGPRPATVAGLLFVTEEMHRRIFFFSILFFAVRAFAQQPTDPRAFSSTGVPHLHNDTATYRLSGGVGGNLAHLSDAPLAEPFLRLTHQDGAWFFGLGLNNSQSTTNPDTQIAIGEFDLLAGYSWDITIPNYQAPPGKIHFGIASGLAICTNTVSVRQPNFFNRRGRFSQSSSVGSLGIPIQFSMIYQVFRYIGVGPLAFAAFSGLQPSYGVALVGELRY